MVSENTNKRKLAMAPVRKENKMHFCVTFFALLVFPWASSSDTSLVVARLIPDLAIVTTNK